MQTTNTLKSVIQNATQRVFLDDLDRNRNNNFDLIRFLAASLVIFSHSYLVTKSFANEPLNNAVGFLNFGQVSVYIFFTISGYLITKSVFKQKSLGRFVWARVLRIFPALAICSILSALVVGPIFSTLPPLEYFSSPEVYRFGLGNATLLDMQFHLPGVFESNLTNVVNTPLWTLKAEILMYIVVFAVGVAKVLFDRAINIRCLLPLVFGVFAYLIAMQLTSSYIFSSAYQWIVFFILGMLTYAFRDRIVLKRTYMAILWLVAIGFTLLHLPGYKATVVAALAYSVFVVAYHPKLQVGNFSKYGDFSYGLYIYAFPIQQALVASKPDMHAWTNFLFTYAIVLPIAILSWHYIENPALSMKDTVLEKAKRRLWSEIVRFSWRKSFYPLLYRCWWHARFVTHTSKAVCQNYMTAVPHPGAGIGHQMANWIAGYWFAQQFQHSFAHIPFSSSKWEALLGFGQGEVTAQDLIRNQSYRKVCLPLFDEFNSRQLEQVRKIIASYADKKVVFVFEQDQFYRDQFGVISHIQQKFYHAAARQHDNLVFSERNFNIAIHVRRGDIVAGQTNDGNTNLTMRWQNSSYFENVLAAVLRIKKFQKPVKIHVFSQGEREEFAAFERLGDVEYCLDMGPHESFLHMVHADLLITSKSSFSYKPALLSKGIKVCPQNFWHGYPQGVDWILANDDGLLDDVAMRKLASI